MSSKLLNIYAVGLSILKEGMSGFDEPQNPSKRPETREEMAAYISRVGVYEGCDFLGVIVENGWAADYAEAEIYLDTLGIFPWDD